LLFEGSRPSLRHSRLDVREKRFDAVLSPVVHELIALERRPGLPPKVFHVTRTAIGGVSGFAPLGLSSGEDAIEDRPLFPSSLCDCGRGKRSEE
jgi:hypothetical protein